MSATIGARYARVYSDSGGESHFADVEVEIKPMSFAPPAPPLELSAFVPARRLAFMVMRSGWRGGWHPAPRRQFLIILSGRIECVVTKDEGRIFNRGDVLLLEDTEGKGHMIHSVEGDALMGVVQLSDSATD
jgi:hypothetical protein